MSKRSDRLNLYDLVGPIIIKIKSNLSLSSHSLSLTAHSLSPSRSLSLPLSLTVPSLSPKSYTPNPSSQINLKATGASNPHGGPSSPHIPPWGALDFKFFARGRSRSRHSNLCRPDLSFEEVLSDFLWSIVSICIPSLGSKGVLIFVG